jgi:CubicO group peptidase (beta-lactamase class C family)
MKRTVRISRNLMIVLVVLYLGLFGLTKAIRYPEPIAAVRLGLAPASKTPTLMPAHTIDPAAAPIPIPMGVQEILPAFVSYNGVNTPWESFLKQTNTNALLILRNGVLTHEWYRAGFGADSQFPSYSVAKTMTSILIGQLVEEGRIKESDTFVSYFPEYANDSAFDRVTIKELLDMQGGIGVKDDYPEGPSGWGVAIAQMYATTDLHWFLGNNRKMAFDPGTSAEYRSVDTQMLGMVISKVTGKKVADLFSERVWQPIGAEFPATWNVDRVGGLEKTFCCFNASVRDYARVGQMLLNRGLVGDERVLSNEWIKRISTPVVTLDHGWGYAAQVWHPFPGTIMALGLHGQFIFINPETRTVIVKVSDNPTGSDNEKPTAEVLRALSQLGS